MAELTHQDAEAAGLPSAIQEKAPMLEQQLQRRARELQVATEALSRVERDLAASQLKLKQANHLLQQRSKLTDLGEMTAMIVHELNQPLMHIQGYVQMILEDSNTDNPYLADLTRLQHQIHRMTDMVTNVREFSYHAETKLIATHIRNPLDDAVKIFSSQITRHNIEMSYRLDPEFPPVIADERKLQQVFINLLSNSIDAVSELNHAKIIIETKRAESAALIRIMNNGPKITKENEQHIFEPFFTTKPVGRGTGLGLAITKRLVADFSGCISYRPDEALGCCFEIELQIAP